MSILVTPKKMIGASKEMKSVFQLIRKAGPMDSSVLITGESGTGKELVAHALHNYSRRKDKPFIAVNCGALSEELLESELFGHIKGSFTGATSERAGRFRVAHEGTLFLHEVNEMSFALQVKILRVLQEGEFEPVGSSRTERVNTRIVCASGVNLDKAVRDEKFREDLYYRLNVIPINIPPLRERREDIPSLIRYFMNEFIGNNECVLKTISPQAMNALCAYPWFGNVRELENFIERVCVLVDHAELLEEDVMEWMNQAYSSKPYFWVPPIPENGIDLREFLDKMEQLLVEQALKLSDGVKAKAAELLRINRTTLIEKQKRWAGESGESNEMDDLEDILSSFKGGEE